jgi:hypothetical protein
MELLSCVDVCVRWERRGKERKLGKALFFGVTGFVGVCRFEEGFMLTCNTKWWFGPLKILVSTNRRQGHDNRGSRRRDGTLRSGSKAGNGTQFVSW